MLMVLMTMAIIIVVGTSMLFVTLSSFSNSIADTQQERAYNAALTVSDTLKGSTQLNTIIETYFTKIKENGSAEVQFYNDTDFDNQAVNYTIVNGVKVYVTLSKSPSSSANKIDKVLVDIKGVKGSQESTVSFEADSVPDGTSTTIQDTFGNSFVVSNNMGSSVTSPYQIYKRIEGDVSINCFETENGERVMKTRIFNPVVLEGVTGSVYANGDLIIGAADNMLRVQGNVYVDGNLTIRGLALGVNLPALTKKYYAKKYLYYYTYAYGEFGSVAVPPNNKAGYKNSSTTKLGEAMYEKLSDGTYRPIQTYDKLSHFTLMDLAGDANEYTFWTKNYGENNTTGIYTWEQVTITLRVKDKNGIWQNIDAEYNQGGINNAQYLGASMYSDTEGDGTPIMQYPQGGNIYCSGDIIFDTVNVGNVFSFDAGVFNTGSTDAGHEDQDEKPDPSALDKINKWLSEHLGIDLVNPRFPYYSYAYNLDGKGDGTIPVHTKIEGDVFCQGRMIIAPDSQKSYINYKDEQWLGIASDLSDTKKYIGGTVVASDDFVLKDSGAFLSQIKDKWQQVTGKKWGDAFDFGTVKLDVTLNRFYTNELVDDDDNTLAEYSGNMASFIKAYKQAYGNEKLSNSESIKRLKEKFEELGKDGYYYLTGGNYTQFGNGNGLNGADIKEKNKTKWYDFRKPEFSATSNLYIQNSPIRKGTSCGDIEHKNSNGVDPCTLEKYASDDKYRVVENVDEKDNTRTKVNGIFYTAALSVRYCEITVNNVFCDGTISVLSSDIGEKKENVVHFVNSAAVNVKNNYFGSDFVKNELKKASIMDFLKNVLQKNNAQLTDEEILKEYFGVDKNKNEFKGETNFVFDVRDDSQDEYEEKWGTWPNNEKDDITHNRKVVIIRAHYEMTETVTWKNEEEWNLSQKDCNRDRKLNRYHRYLIKKHGEDWSYKASYSEGKYVADIAYCIEDNATSSKKGYTNNEKNATDKLIMSNGDIIEYDKRGRLGLSPAEEALVKYLYESRKSGDYKYALSLTQTAFIDFTTKPTDETGKEYSDIESYFKAKHIAGFDNLTDNPSGTDGVVWGKKVSLSADCSFWLDYKEEHDKNLKEHNSPESVSYYTSASRERTARYDFTLKPFANITGGSELAGLDKLSYVLNGNDILRSAFLNTEYLITMFSNGANDFDGIDLNALLGAAANGLVGSAIIGGKLKTFGTGSTSNQFDAMKGTTKAFNEGLYGMYLAVDNRYSLVDNTATVKAIFEEIKSPEFATVVEANANQDQAIKNVKKILEDLKDKGDIEEYNAFDIYGAVNRYDENLGIKSGKKVTDYICADNKKLTKKYVRSKRGGTMPANAESWLTTDTLDNENSSVNIRRWYYLEPSNEVEDSDTLRLMDFYNTNDKNGKHLRADSTFAIDEKYNQTFTALKDMDVDWSNLKIKANRSEVQYTIKQNTYFNFELSNTQVVFAASTDGVDKRVRMNFLIDTSEKDIYVFFHCKLLDKTKDKDEQTRFLFQKCSFQVTGKNNAYLMLVEDTSFAANAFSLEISNTMLSEDKTDEKVGTHFKSNTYQKYVARFKGHGRELKGAWNIVGFIPKLLDSIQMQALPEGDPAKVGNMFIIGMGRNYVKFGRGGSVNAMVYIPNGMYSNESSGLFNSIPIGNSGNNEASIVAKDIYIGGSSRGQLIFSSYDAAKIGSKNNNSSGLVMDGLINPDTVSHDTKWVAGDYYYG